MNAKEITLLSQITKCQLHQVCAMAIYYKKSFYIEVLVEILTIISLVYLQTVITNDLSFYVASSNRTLA